MSWSRIIVIVGAIALSIATGATHGARADDQILSGKIVSKSGTTLNGVTVSAKREGSTITTSVYTDATGFYYFPPMAAGKYRVWAQALGFEATKVAISVDGRTSQDMALTQITDPELLWRQLPGELMLASLPEATREDAYVKKIISDNCTSCHTPSYAFQFRFDETGWNRIIDLMKTISPGSQVITMNQERIAKYLAKVRGPGPTLPIKERPRPSGEAARVVWTLYDVPRMAGIGAKALGDRPSETDGSDWAMGTPSAIGKVIHDDQMDLDGNIWFSTGRPNAVSTIGKVNAVTGAVTYKKVPMDDPKNTQAATGHGLTRDARGNIWFNVNKGRAGLGKINPRTEEIAIYTPPKEMQPTGGATSLDVDGNGNIWVSAPWGALRFDPQTQKFTEFNSLKPQRPYGTGMTYGVAVDRSGNGWWAQMGLDTIGKGDPVTGKVIEIVLPENKPARDMLLPAELAAYEKVTDISISVPYPWSQGPRRIGTDKNADLLWVANSWGASLARIDTRTNAVTMVAPPDKAMKPYHVSVDSQHNVWGDLWTADVIYRYNPTTKKWTTFELPVRGTEIRHLTADESSGSLKISMAIFRTNQMGIMTIRSEAEIARLKQQVVSR